MVDMRVAGFSLKWPTVWWSFFFFFFFFFLWVIHYVYTSQIKRKDGLNSSIYKDSRCF